MNGHTVILRGDTQKQHAKNLIDRAPLNYVVNIKAQKRTLEQNNRMWAMLSDISQQKPEDRFYTPDVWKAVFMNALGHQIQFVEGLDGEPFPMGFKSSNLTVKQMIDLIEFIYFYGAQHNIRWSDEEVAA